MARNVVGDTMSTPAELRAHSDQAGSSLSHMEVVVTPSDTRVLAGATFTLQCRAFATRSDSLRWTRNDLDLPRDPRINVLGEQLVVTSARMEDRGLYRCSVATEHGVNSAIGQS